MRDDHIPWIAVNENGCKPVSGQGAHKLIPCIQISIADIPWAHVRDIFKDSFY